MIPLSVRVGERDITRRLDDLTYRKTQFGTSEISFQYATGLSTDLPAYEWVTVYDGTTADVLADGRLEDPGRTVDADGERWDMSAIGEVARAGDNTVTRIYIDSALDGFEEATTNSASRSVSVSTVPQPGDTPGPDALVMQFTPGNPIANNSVAAMTYKGLANIGQRLGGFGFDHWDGSTNTRYRVQGRTEFSDGSHSVDIARSDSWSATQQSVGAASAGAQFTTGADVLTLRVIRISGGATVVRADNVWGAFLNVWVRGIIKDKTGADITGAGTYTGYILAHEVVNDLLGRGVLPYDASTAVVDTSAAYQFDQLSYPDGATAEQILEALMEMLPDYYWQVGPRDPVTGKSSFTWRKWPTSVRYQLSVKGGVNLPGADAERYNRVTVRWKNKRGETRTTVYNAGTTIAGTFVPSVPELDAAGLTREPEIMNLSDEVGSQANADKAALEFLLAHGTPPASGTVTVGGKCYDNDLGRYVQPWEIEPGYLGRVAELGDSADDLSATSRNGKSVFRIVSMTYTASENSTQLELDAPQRDDQNLLAGLIGKREPKR